MNKSNLSVKNILSPLLLMLPFIILCLIILYYAFIAHNLLALALVSLVGGMIAILILLVIGASFIYGLAMLYDILIGSSKS